MQKHLFTRMIALLFSTGVFLFSTSAGAQSALPRYTAYAVFSINWGQMRIGDQTQDQQKARRKFNASLAKFKVSDQFILLLCEDCGVPGTQSASMRSNLGRYMRVTPAGMTNDCYLYRVQFEGNDQDIALKAVNLLSSRFVTSINRRAKLQNADKALHAYEDNADSRLQDQKLKEELADLSQQQNRGFSQDRQARIQTIKDQLNDADLDKMTTGFALLGGVVGVFLNPARIEQAGVVQTSVDPH